jgi:hypothetical protein
MGRRPLERKWAYYATFWEAVDSLILQLQIWNCTAGNTNQNWIISYNFWGAGSENLVSHLQLVVYCSAARFNGHDLSWFCGIQAYRQW